MPDWSWSSDRAIWGSLVLGSRFRLIARCRSSRESLMWSARRKSCEELVVIVRLARKPVDDFGGQRRGVGIRVNTKVKTV